MILHDEDMTLRWRHNDGVSNRQPPDCLLNRLFRRRSKKISKLRVTGVCAGNSLVASEFLAHMASNAENVSMWWRHHDAEKNSRFTDPSWGKPPVTNGFPLHKGPVMRNFTVFFDVILKILLNQQSMCWWFSTRWRSCDFTGNGASYPEKVKLGQGRWIPELWVLPQYRRTYI